MLLLNIGWLDKYRSQYRQILHVCSARIALLGFHCKGCLDLAQLCQVLIWANVAGWQRTDRVASHKLVYLGRGWCEV